MNKFTVGSRVKQKGVDEFGTVIFDNGDSILIEFDNTRPHLHDGMNISIRTGKPGRCWWWNKTDLERALELLESCVHVEKVAEEKDLQFFSITDLMKKLKI